MFRDDIDAFLDDATLVVLPQATQRLGIGATVAEHVVPALFDLLDDVRILLADCRIQQDRSRRLTPGAKLEEAPAADASAVVAPRVIAGGLRGGAIVRIDSLAGLKREVLDVERDVERKPVASRPRILLALRDRQEV